MKNNDNASIVIIDTFGFLFRSFYALPLLKSKKGFPTGLLTGFANFIYSLGSEYDTSYIIFAIDTKGDTFRHKIFEQYKANRQEAPIELKQQIPIAIDWIKKMNFTVVGKEGFEADDIIASIANVAKKVKIKVKIISHDKDLNQLITQGVEVYHPLTKTIFTKEKCFDKFGVYPHQFIDYQSIVGDSSDNIPGVKGIGTKGASKLLGNYETLEDIYKNIDFITPERTKKLLIENRDNAFMSKKLVTLKTDIYDEFSFEECTYPTINPILAIRDELIELDMSKILDKVNTSGMYVKTKEPIINANNKTQNFETILLDNKDILLKTIENIPDNSIVAFDTETDSLDVQNANIVGFSFCYDEEKAYYVPIGHIGLINSNQISMQDAKVALLLLLKYKIVGHNLKFDMHIIYYNFCITQANILADTIIISWLIDPASEKSLDFLAQKYLHHTNIKFKDIVGKKDTFANIEIQSASIYASEDAWISYRLYFTLIKKLENKLNEIANNIEYPFIQTLLDIEQNGIKVDIDFLKDFHIQAKDNIKKLTENIYTLTNQTFNINSPKQLGSVLFDVLELPAVKKTKTGYSTDEQSLSQIQEHHPVIKEILEYREIYKLNSTYIEPLIQIGSKSKDCKIHTSFSQIGTASGRLSSNNPNLQNIPVRHELGRKIRQGFIASDGCDLIGIDYSQIELRLLAHFSQDKYLIEAFMNDKDIHLQTAIKLFGEDEALEKRGVAKSINFGILYGMGSRKLSKILNISAKEAKRYIESYFDTFENVKDNLDDIKEFMQEHGYVQTLLGRKRYFDFKNATAFEMSNYLRMGVNTVFQGSAADLIKLSMNQITKRYQNKDVKILLQIHDEIILQTKKDISQQIAKECSQIMENIVKLEVPLKTSVHIGKNWGELK